jgi:hypothetical protein
MLAEDYFPSRRAWKQVRPRFPDELRTTRDAINKLLAHLSYERHDFLSWTGWRVTVLHNHLLDCAAVMRNNMPSGRRAWIKVPTIRLAWDITAH